MKTGLERLGIIILVLCLAGAATVIVALQPPKREPIPLPEQAADLPQSVLGYSGGCSKEEEAQGLCTAAETIPCYANEKLIEFIQKKRSSEGMEISVSGKTDDGKRMDIYKSAASGAFIVLVTGPDGAGGEEGCVQMSGRDITFGTSSPPVPASSVSVPSGGETGPDSEPLP